MTLEEIGDEPAIKYLNQLKGAGAIPKKSKLDKAVNAILTADSKGDPIANQFIKDAEDIVLDLDRIGKVEALEKTLKGIGLSRESVDVKNYGRARLNAAVVLGMIGAYAYDQTNNMRDASECGTNTLCAYKHELAYQSHGGLSGECEDEW